MKYGLLFQKGGLWVGAHYNPHYRRWCINLFPCLTIWVCLKGGTVPHGKGLQAGPMAGNLSFHR